MRPTGKLSPRSGMLITVVHTVKGPLMRIVGVLIVSTVLLSPVVWAETITIGTYNIEVFSRSFLAHRLTTRPFFKDNQDNPDLKELLEDERRSNDENNWEAAQVILDPAFNPDVLVLQEGCGLSDLEFFNKRWLQGAYETLLVFPTNTTRDQNLCMLLKPGFKVLERRDQYYLEPDTVGNDRGERLFARGPAFALVQSPSGYQFWVGTTHQKSKGGNNVEVTKWRNREAKRTNDIMAELSKRGTVDLVLLGDMNDELGMQEFEQEAGGDTITTLVGPPENGMVLATKPLVDAGKISFGGYWKTNYRSFIDHVIITTSMKDQVEEVNVFQDGFAKVASDHYPVYIRIKADPVSRN